MNQPDQQHYNVVSFFRFGPFIATFILIFLGHSPLIFFEPIRFLTGLVTPSILFSMLALMVLALIVGFCIGILPTYITGLIFQKLIQNKIKNLTLLQSLFYGFCAGLSWMVWVLIGLLEPKVILPILIFVGMVIIPTSMLCALLEWRRINKLKILKPEYLT